jgi:hypothetical protein
MTVFLDYIEKSANRECPGGLFGCQDKSANDTHCQDRISYFLEKNFLSNQAIQTKTSPITIIFVFSILPSIQITNIICLSLTCHI